MDRVTDLNSPPVVGREYLVPHVVGKDHSYPTLGPSHEDRSFAPALGRHVHYDPRFIEERLVEVEVDGLSPERVAMVIAHRVFRDMELVEVPAKCLREMPPFPRGHESAPWVPDLERAHRGCRVAADGRCPHAGTDGRSFPRAADGSWECIHGLRWAADGSLVPG